MSTTIQRTNGDLLDEVQRRSGTPVGACFQCHKCSTGCPIGPEMDYLPSQVMRLIHFGAEAEVLESQAIWLCASCEACTTRCPQGIDIAGVMDALRHISIAEGIVSPAVKNVPKLHEAFLSSIKSNGRVHETGMMADFIFKTNPLSKLANGELLDISKLGWDMMRRGKINIRPRKIRQTEDIKKVFAKSKK